MRLSGGIIKDDDRRLAVLVALIAILTGLLLSSDSKASTADTSIPNNEITSSVN